ncbi:hypothetical protein BDV25DRAFT_150019 [Aspergillus avenaceus]|uniref:Uncharacterized protein n=1 Tax=Aspergillus avenaceus TaxID=36643 RepID=A0A5N6U3J4_ASPAV|nr:hypothetical protein BDV25DRAFT_150019 [Aspergillus avenaceus]
MPASLLDLPSELINHIIHLVLIYEDTPRPCPEPPYEYHVSWYRDSHDCLTQNAFGPKHVKYWKGQERRHKRWFSNPLALLLVNRRISQMTRWRLDRLPRSCALDVMLLGETYLLPTWISLPAPCRQIEDLTATIRIVGNSLTLNGRQHRFYPGEEGSPPLILWSFYYLLERFLEVGPLAEHRQPEPRPRLKRMPFTINRLTLNCVSCPQKYKVAPPDMSIWTWMEGSNSDTEPAGRYEGVLFLLMRPDWLARLINEYIGYLLGMDSDMALYGAMLYEYVGSIRVCIDGEVLKEYHLDRRLKDLNYTSLGDVHGDSWRQTRWLPPFAQWKKRVGCARARAGLPVLS